ncbi:MAG: hypothetical protein SangKO_038750 [Sandaracinaceae bacterium]
MPVSAVTPPSVGSSPSSHPNASGSASAQATSAIQVLVRIMVLLVVVKRSAVAPPERFRVRRAELESASEGSNAQNDQKGHRES